MWDADKQPLLKEASSFRAKKSLGQNFLVDVEHLEHIAEQLELKPSDHVLEIGPGLGFLTRILAASKAHITAVELDQDCVDYLNDRGLASNVHLVHGDFLDFDLGCIKSDNIKVVGNVPYQITTPIIARLLGEIDAPSPWLNRIDRIVMTVQLEVARRLTAQADTDDYSQISTLINYFAASKLLFKVEPSAFYPVPEVTSAVVQLTPLESPSVRCRNPRLLRQLIRAGFKQRRKMLRNNLAFLHLNNQQIAMLFRKLNFDPQTRAERLSLTQFARLADEIEELRGSQASEE